MPFTHFNLHEKLVKSIEAERFKEPTDVQKAAIPSIIEGRDLLVTADTGSGKTAAYVLPSLHRLMNRQPAKEGIGPRVVIMAPTRELADQVFEVIRKLSRFTSLRAGVITGGVAYFGQENLLRKPLDLLVATPGRLLDHMNKGRVDYSRLELFILDEADRMLDMGFMKDIEKIYNSLPAERQILLFSATFEENIKKIAKRFLNNPNVIQLTSSKKENLLISQLVHLADNFKHKMLILDHILSQTSLYQAIVFTATKRGASDLADELSAKRIPCSALHGDMRQSKRNFTIDNFRRGKTRILVATDVAARGLDVKNLSHVINFDLPKSGEDYIHRIGRTGRAGETGIAISLVGPNEGSLLSQIERFTGKLLERKTIEGLEPKLKPSTQNSRGPSRPRNRFNSDKPNRFNTSERPRRFSVDEKPNRFNSSEKPNQFRGDDRPKRFSSDKPNNRYINSEKPNRFSNEKPNRFSSEKPKRSFGKSSSNSTTRVNGKSNYRSGSSSDNQFSHARPKDSNFKPKSKSKFSNTNPRSLKVFNNANPKREFSKTPKKPARKSLEEIN